MRELLIFDRINLANCAKQRAELVDPLTERFLSEYRTARMWVKYRCVITNANHSVIELP